jgi:hypothetical protein
LHYYKQLKEDPIPRSKLLKVDLEKKEGAGGRSRGCKDQLNWEEWLQERTKKKIV